MATTVFSNLALTGPPDQTVAGGAVLSWRLHLLPSVSGLGQVRITLKAGSTSAVNSTGIFCDHVSIGVSSGTEPNTSTVPVEVTFPGFAHGCKIDTPLATAVSDWVNLSFTSTDKLVVTLDQDGAEGFCAAENGTVTVGSLGNVWFINPGTSWNQSAPTGMSNFGAFAVAVTLIETQAAAGVTAKGGSTMTMMGV